MHNMLEHLKAFPHIRLANKNDNEAILNFYHQTEMSTKEKSIKYGRGNDFFAFLNERSDKFLVITLWSDQNRLEGVSVISYRPGFINGKSVTVGYLGDLRVNLNRKLIKEWRRFYSDFIKYSPIWPETFYCRYYQTVIIDDNTKARANLVSNRIKNLNYKLLESYTMLNIVGRIRVPHIYTFKIASPSNEEIQELINFMNQEDSKRVFGHDWTTEFNHRLKNWNNFSIQNLRIIRDSHQKIVAIASFWNPIATKQITTTKVPFFFKIFIPLINFIPFIEMKKLPEENKPINILYLNQIIFKNDLNKDSKKEIINLIINDLFKLDFNILGYCDFYSQNLISNDLMLIKHNIKMAMYSVHHEENNEIRDEIHLNSKSQNDPGFEMALV